VSRVCGLSVWRCAYRLLHLTVVCLQVKLSIVQLVDSGGVRVESVWLVCVEVCLQVVTPDCGVFTGEAVNSAVG